MIWTTEEARWIKIENSSPESHRDAARSRSYLLADYVGEAGARILEGVERTGSWISLGRVRH